MLSSAFAKEILNVIEGSIEQAAIFPRFRQDANGYR
jgi:hypothetical protein